MTTDERLDNLFSHWYGKTNLDRKQKAFVDVYGTMGSVEGDGLHSFWEYSSKSADEVIASFRVAGEGDIAALIDQTRFVKTAKTNDEGFYDLSDKESNLLSAAEEAIWGGALKDRLIVFVDGMGVSATVEPPDKSSMPPDERLYDLFEEWEDQETLKRKQKAFVEMYRVIDIVLGDGLQFYWKNSTLEVEEVDELIASFRNAGEGDIADSIDQTRFVQSAEMDDDGHCDFSDRETRVISAAEEAFMDEALWDRLSVFVDSIA